MAGATHAAAEEAGGNDGGIKRWSVTELMGYGECCGMYSTCAQSGWMYSEEEGKRPRLQSGKRIRHWPRRRPAQRPDRALETSSIPIEVVS
jgi:hypothetical protein